MSEIYISTDVESDGPIPGPHSMLSFGSAAYTADKQLLSTFSANLHTLPGAEADPKTAAWKKLALNCAGAVNALTLQPAGVARREPIADIMRALVAECVAVGRAEGADLPSDLPDSVVEGYRAGPADGVNSLHADRAAGRPMELDARNGVIVRRGARHGIATPVNAMVVALLEAAATA